MIKTIKINTGFGHTIKVTRNNEQLRRAIYRAFDNGATIKELADHWNLTIKEVRQLRADYRNQK